MSLCVIESVCLLSLLFLMADHFQYDTENTQNFPHNIYFFFHQCLVHLPCFCNDNSNAGSPDILDGNYSPQVTQSKLV